MGKTQLHLPFISDFVNRCLAALPGFHLFTMANILIAKPDFRKHQTSLPSVSVIVPARNKTKNIAPLIARLPKMGPDDKLSMDAVIYSLVTIVIVNYNRRNDLREALLTIGKQDYSKKEVIVVDNASQDDSCGMLQKEFPDIRLIPLRVNIGMDGYSVGFKHAKGEIIFQMDNDSLMPDTNVITEVVKRFRNGPENLAVVATRVEEYQKDNNNIEELRNNDHRPGPLNTGGFHSGGVGFRKSLLNEVGYYNRDVFLYSSELFLQMKFLSLGYKIFYYPEILMLHKSSLVARSSLGLYYELRNRYWFMRRFATLFQQTRFLPSMLLHDIIYVFSKKKPYVFFYALKDGFGHMPESLQPKLLATRKNFVDKVNEVGANFNFKAILKLIRKRLKIFN